MKPYQKPLLLCLVACFGLAPLVFPVLEEIPQSGGKQMAGVWVSDYGTSIAKGRETIRSEVKEIAAKGYKKAYVSVYTPRIPIASTIPYAASPSFLASWLYLHELYVNKIDTYAWIEYGLKMHPSQKLYKDHPEWFLGVHNGMAWLDPSHPKAKAYILTVIDDAMSPFFVTGIHLDDNWSIPSHFGDYRSSLTELTRDIKTHIDAVSKQSGKRITLSLSANPLPYARSSQNQDWMLWIQEGLVDEMTLQAYRPTETLNATIASSGIKEASDYVPVSIGVSAIGEKGHNATVVKEQFDVVKQLGYAPALFTVDHAKYNQWHTSLMSVARRIALFKKQDG